MRRDDGKKNKTQERSEGTITQEYHRPKTNLGGSSLFVTGRNKNQFKSGQSFKSRGRENIP